MPDDASTPTVKTVAWKDLAPDQQEAAHREASQLVEQDSEVNLITAAMLGSMQLYHTARQALGRTLDRLGYKPDDGVETCLIEGCLQKGQQPFERSSLMDRLTRVTALFLQAEVHRDREQTALAVQAERAAQEQQRRETPLPLPAITLPGDYTLPPREVPRGKILVIVSDLADIEQFFAALRQPLLELPDTTHLFWRANNNPVYLPAGQIRTHELPETAWRNLAASPARLRTRLQEWGELLMGGRSDALLIEDLSQVHTQSLFVGGDILGNRIRQAGNAVRPLRRVAGELGFSVLAGLALDVRTQEEWQTVQQTVRTHQHLSHDEQLFLVPEHLRTSNEK